MVGVLPGIGVVYNPKSGHNRRNPKAAARLRKAVGDHGVVREASTMAELYRVAEDFQRQGIDVLGISGGDGTNGVTITGFIDVYRGAELPRIAFLRGGTMNTVANSVGIRRGAPEVLVRRLIDGYQAHATRPLRHAERHTLRIQATALPPPSAHDDEGSPRSVAPPAGDKYGFLFGTGVVYGFLAEYYAGGDPNPVVAAKTLARGIGSTIVQGEMIRRMAAPFRGSVTLDDGTRWEESEYLTVTGGTIDQIGLGFRPFCKFDERPGAFHLLGIHGSTMQVVGQLPRVYRAQPIAEHCARHATPSRAVIESSAPHIRYMVDGDLHECTGPLTVEVGPKVRIVIL